MEFVVALFSLLILICVIRVIIGFLSIPDKLDRIIEILEEKSETKKSGKQIRN